MDVNEETDILDRLGILDSTLKCPNKQFPVAKGRETSTGQTANPTSSSSTPFLEAGDEWSGFSLDELSSSSDDSELLFNRMARNVSTSGGTVRRFREHRQGRGRHRHASKTGSPNFWKLLALFGVAFFMDSYGIVLVFSCGQLV
uniref:Ion_trans_N domain-containing protein n=1 Tax=Globodera pallida TaxID=36090 RepID=A0A183BXT9_GLOPA